MGEGGAATKDPCNGRRRKTPGNLTLAPAPTSDGSASEGPLPGKCQGVRRLSNELDTPRRPEGLVEMASTPRERREARHVRPFRSATRDQAGRRAVGTLVAIAGASPQRRPRGRAAHAPDKRSFGSGRDFWSSKRPNLVLGDRPRGGVVHGGPPRFAFWVCGQKQRRRQGKNSRTAALLAIPDHRFGRRSPRRLRQPGAPRPSITRRRNRASASAASRSANPGRTPGSHPGSPPTEPNR